MNPHGRARNPAIDLALDLLPTGAPLAAEDLLDIVNAIADAQDWPRVTRQALSYIEAQALAKLRLEAHRRGIGPRDLYRRPRREII